MKCEYCGAEIQPDSQFCRECGAKVEIHKVRFCRECGSELMEDSKFCSECGAKIETDFAINKVTSQKVYLEEKPSQDIEYSPFKTPEQEEDPLKEAMLQKADKYIGKISKAIGFVNKIIK